MGAALYPTVLLMIVGRCRNHVEEVLMNKIAVFVLAAALSLAVAAPAFATASGGAGRDFAEHHATHAQEMSGFTGAMNPGVMHEGFAGWTGM